MTATISMPQELYEQATEAAQSMGISQRRFFIAAIREFLDNQKVRAMQDKLNDVHENYSPDELDLKAEAVGLESLRELTKNDTW